MVRVAIVGLGKMGLSHLSMIRMHPQVDVVAVCDTSGFILDILKINAGLPVFSDFENMLRTIRPDAVVVATPSGGHESLVRSALGSGAHVFCEKPFCLNADVSEELAGIAEAANLVNQVGYHYRFVGAFQEMKRLVDAGAIGRPTHALAEAYGPVVLRASGTTWRTVRNEGGGCLYDYAAHPVNLLNWIFGIPRRVRGSVLNSVFSRDTDDEVYSTFEFADNMSAQISVNWSDESCRKMSVKLSVWGTHGRIIADRQECQSYIRSGATPPEGYEVGWNIRNTTELTAPVWFYLRGEEYSAQLDHFVECIRDRNHLNVNTFRSAAVTDRVLAMMRDDSTAATAAPYPVAMQDAQFAPKLPKSFFRR